MEATLSIETPPTLGEFTIPTSTLRPTALPSERVAVVTGANQGLGFGIVKGLCESFDGYIYLTARDKKKGADAVQALKDMKVCRHPDKLRFHELNVLNEEHTDDLYCHLRDTHGGIDILINNAAIAYKRASTVPFAIQAENTILTNYLGLVRTCVFLFPLLRRHGRVVNLSSSAGHLSQISNFALKKRLMEDALTEKRLTDIMYEFMDITKEHPRAHVELGWPDSAYAVSKIGVNLVTKIYQRKFDSMLGDNDLIINAVHPGYVATNMSSYMGNVNIFQAAAVVLYAATLPPHVKEPRGELIWSDGNWIDMDSPTTPETDSNINEYDIVEDLRHYLNYTSTSRLPNIQAALDEDDAYYKKEKAKEERNVTLVADREEVHAQETTEQTTKPASAQTEKPAQKDEKPSNLKGTRAKGNTLKSTRTQKSRGNKSARAVRAVSDGSSTKTYRTVTRGTLPEEYLSSFKYWHMSHRHLISTLPPPRA